MIDQIDIQHPVQMYSCGDWIKSNPLPDGKSNWGTFSKLWQDNQSIMRSVLGKQPSLVPRTLGDPARPVRPPSRDLAASRESLDGDQPQDWLADGLCKQTKGGASRSHASNLLAHPMAPSPTPLSNNSSPQLICPFNLPQTAAKLLIHTICLPSRRGHRLQAWQCRGEGKDLLRIVP